VTEAGEARAFDFDEQCYLGPALDHRQHIGQQRNTRAAVLVAEPMRFMRLNLCDLIRPQIKYHSPTPGGARQLMVVNDHWYAIGRDVNVQLQKAHAEAERGGESGQRIFGKFARVAPVGYQMNQAFTVQAAGPKRRRWPIIASQDANASG
jgi:hypothetical protein